MEEETIVKVAGENPSLQPPLDKSKPRSKSKSKRPKSLASDVPVQTGVVFRDPATGKFMSASASGSEAPSLEKVSQNSDVVRDVHDLINVDKSDISDLTNISDSLLQSERFQASLMDMVQRAHHAQARTQQSRDVAAPPKTGLDGRDLFPAMGSVRFIQEAG